MFTPVFVDHKGCRILRVDFSGLSVEQLVDATKDAMRAIAAEPLGSVRILTIANGQLDAHSAEAIRRYAAHNKPYVRASAVVGASGFQKILVVSIKVVQGRAALQTFESEEQAKDWLASH